MIEGIGILFTRFSAEQFNAGKLQDDFKFIKRHWSKDCQHCDYNSHMFH
jgi:hypothetical protein